MNMVRGTMQVLRGKNAEGANKLLQSLAKAAHILNLDGSEAVQVLFSSRWYVF